MNAKTADGKMRKEILGFQKNEKSEHLIYGKLSRSVKDAHNRKVLERISADELRHHNVWKKYTGAEVAPSMLMVWKYYLISRILGITFGIKLMEKGEESAQKAYSRVAARIPEALKIEREENEHENELIGMINEERLKYVGSIVLGLNDALVELTGALAGFTLAFQNTAIIALAGLITGIAASLSMGASEYLSTKSEEDEGGTKSPVRASVYTSAAYVLTVIFLMAPFFVFGSAYTALAATLACAVIVIFVFTFYVSVAKDLPFRRRFAEMVGVSMGVAGVTFVIGFLIKTVMGIDV
jgi:VIT1/CCC1 family predicted Fe2+/Mn2+ transporter